MSKNTIRPKDLAEALLPLEQFLADRAVTETDRENFRGSAARVARMYFEMAWQPKEIADAIEKILKVTFPVGESSEAGMVTQGPIVLNSMCPHHFLPVRYNAYLSYLPKQGGKVLGLSKLARIPEYLSKRFVLQEQLAKDIADVFYKPADMALFTDEKIRQDEANYPVAPDFDFETDGAIVALIGVHTCESCRGVNQDARTMVTERRGAFTESDMEARFNQAMAQLRVERPFGG